MMKLLLVSLLALLAFETPVQAQTAVAGRTSTGRIQTVKVGEDGTIAVSSTGGDASAANQTAIQANPGSDATKATAVQGVTNGKPISTSPVDAGAVTFTAGGAVNAVLFSTDTSGYGGIAVHFTGTFVATTTFQGSDDNTNWVAINAQQSTTLAFATTNATTNLLFYIPAQHRYVRAIVTAYTSGSVNGNAFLRYSSLYPATSVVTLGAGATNVGTVQLSAGATAATGAPLYSSYFYTATASTNSTLILTGTRRLFGGQLCNHSVTFRYVKFFNKATAPTVGTDTPVLIIGVPPTSCIPIADRIGTFGQYYSLGLGFGITNAWVATDTTATTAGDVTLSLLYL